MIIYLRDALFYMRIYIVKMLIYQGREESTLYTIMTLVAFVYVQFIRDALGMNTDWPTRDIKRMP